MKYSFIDYDTDQEVTYCRDTESWGMSSDEGRANDLQDQLDEAEEFIAKLLGSYESLSRVAEEDAEWCAAYR